MKLRFGIDSPLGRASQTLALAFAVAASMALGACSNADGNLTQPVHPIATGSARTSDAELLRVVTTTNFVADWVRAVGGDHVDVFSLLPVGADPHSWQPGAGDVAKIADANVIFSIGLELEADWLDELLRNASTDVSKIVALGAHVDPIDLIASDAHDSNDVDVRRPVVFPGGGPAPQGNQDSYAVVLGSRSVASSVNARTSSLDLVDGPVPIGAFGVFAPSTSLMFTPNRGLGVAIARDHDDDSDDDREDQDHNRGPRDPHFWFDPIRVKVAVGAIVARLSALDQERRDTYRRDASAYNNQLGELHAWTAEQLEAIPNERRLLVTSHDSLEYFARLYGFDIVGTVLPSSTTDVEASAQHLGDLVEQLRERGVSVVFGETTVSERLATAIATETGATLVRLYSGSLGPEGSGAETYISMMRTNIERIVDALT